MALGTDTFALKRAPPTDSDVLWHPWNGTFFSSTLPAVVTIHDAVPFRYPAPDKQTREHQQAPFLRSARTARRIIAVSRFGAGEIADCLGVPSDRIDVIYHGVEESFAPGEPDALPRGLAPKEFFLFIGDHTEARKNFDVLAQAWMRAQMHRDGVALAVISNSRPQVPGVVHVPLLTDDFRSPVNARLRALYRGALALCLPSYYETFGMPMIEAMACGTPVLASRASCLPEIGDDCALFLEPLDSDEWIAALRRINADPTQRKQLSRKGLKQARRYRWEDCAAQTLAVLRGASAG